MNWTEQSLFQASPNGLNRECTGSYSTNCGSVQPEFMATQRLTLQTTVLNRDVDVSVLWRFIDEMNAEPSGASSFLPEFTLGIMNIADRQPDVVGSNIGTTAFNTGNIYPSTYDPLGRR